MNLAEFFQQTFNEKHFSLIFNLDEGTFGAFMFFCPLRNSASQSTHFWVNWLERILFECPKVGISKKVSGSESGFDGMQLDGFGGSELAALEKPTFNLWTIFVIYFMAGEI